MRTDQFEKIQQLSEKVADVVIKDLDPSGWVGHGQAPNELSRDLRGDAYWCRKMAAASLSLLVRVTTFTNNVLRDNGPQIPGEGEPGAPEDDPLDKEIADAEKEADKLINRLTGVTKAAFDKKVHGKP